MLLDQKISKMDTDNTNSLQEISYVCATDKRTLTEKLEEKTQAHFKLQEDKTQLYQQYITLLQSSNDHKTSAEQNLRKYEEMKKLYDTVKENNRLLIAQRDRKVTMLLEEIQQLKKQRESLNPEVNDFDEDKVEAPQFQQPDISIDENTKKVEIENSQDSLENDQMGEMLNSHIDQVQSEIRENEHERENNIDSPLNNEAGNEIDENGNHNGGADNAEMEYALDENSENSDEREIANGIQAAPIVPARSYK